MLFSNKPSDFREVEGTLGYFKKTPDAEPDVKKTENQRRSSRSKKTPRSPDVKQSKEVGT